MQILVVDDSKAMRLIVTRTLRSAGFKDCTIVEAENGQDALAKIQASTPDLVLCDWNMPVMTGPELLKAIKDADIRVKFGFVTSESSPDFLEQAKQSGALFVITKPFTAENFEKTLTPLMAGGGVA